MANKMYRSSDFYEEPEDAVREFFHYAKNHKEAAQELIKPDSNGKYLDSAGYLYHHAFEILFKGLHLYHSGEFKKTHKLSLLAEKLPNSFSDEEKSLLKLLNDFQHLKYPIEKKLRNNSFGEIGDEDLEKAETLFLKLWKNLQEDEKIEKIISNIDPTKKGGRQLMRKKRD